MEVVCPALWRRTSPSQNPYSLGWRCCPDSKDKELTCELGKIWRERSFPLEGPLG